MMAALRRKSILSFGLLFMQSIFWHANADVYMHNPRGSNNRLHENGANRANNNRLFDSQNNNRGGYNVGDKGPQPSRNVAAHQYEMEYLMSGKKGQSTEPKGKSFLTVEWTNQHGCGDDDLNCNVVLQYMCQAENEFTPREALRNGITTQTPTENAPNPALGLHEPWEWYDKCKTRSRNKGLFLADQRLRGTTSKYTRQNPNGARSGYECPEERDYYPYWHPTDWIDDTVYVKRQEDCAFYESESFNHQMKGECLVRQGPRWNHKSEFNNYWDCTREGGTWVMMSNFLELNLQMNTKQKCDQFQASNPDIRTRWAIPYRSYYFRYYNIDLEKAKTCLTLPPKVKCKVAPTSRPNHLGNGDNVIALRHQWILPYSPTGRTYRCVYRIRYNISTDDYNASETFAASNERKPHNIVVNQSPVENDPVVQYGENRIDLQLAINTAQFGRTFQDRSHTFVLKPRPSNLNDANVHNINVRGKRGNIVQVYPAVEYDFIPKRPSIKAGDLVHFQWTGSNTNPNNFDGEGQRGTDRSNIVQMSSADVSYPVTGLGTLIQNAQIVHKMDPKLKTASNDDLAVLMASSCAFQRKADLFTARLPSPYDKRNYQKLALLDFFPASCSLPIIKLQPGTYLFMSTRNNNFSNRSQKGRLTVTA